MMRWLRKRAVKARPEAINRKGRFVLERLGEYYSEPSKLYPGDILPPDPPRFGKRFDAGRLKLETDFSCLVITWDGKRVFSHDTFEASRFNYGEDWLAELNAIYDDLQSKDRRGHAARWRDV